MGLLQWLFGNGGPEREPEKTASAESFPWDAHPSIYEHIKAHIHPGHQGLTEGGETLPDEERFAEGKEIRWAPGAMDGVISHHVRKDDSRDTANELLSLVQRYCNAPTVQNKAGVYEFLVKNDTLGLIDPFVDSLTNQSGINHDRLYDLARSLASEAPDRGPVKFGIAILGLYRDTGNEDIFHTLGRHDEFTLFCTVALSNSCENPEVELWKLAKQVDGWGRIHIVERLAGTEDPQIKEWLLREGYKNSVMYEYLAYTCAESGGLITALKAEKVNDELLTSAGEIIQALIAGGPAENMDDYEEGAAVVELYLGHLKKRATSLSQFLAVTAIRGYLGDSEADWDTRGKQGWTPEKRTFLMELCSEIIAQDHWRKQVLDGLKSDDDVLFFKADQAAAVLGIDTWQAHWNRLETAPRNSMRWFPVMKACNEDRITEILVFAGEKLPLDEVATGPGTEVGLGKGYEVHSCLDCILQELGRFPNQGEALVRAALKSPVIRNRNMAVRVLSEWGRERWPEGMKAALEKAISAEPEKDVQERMKRVRDGLPLEEQ